MKLSKTLAAMALGAIAGVVFVECNRSASNIVHKGRHAVMDKMDEMKMKAEVNELPENE